MVVIRHVSLQPIKPIVSNGSGLVMHREGAHFAGLVTRLSTTLTCGVRLSRYTLLREAAPGQARPTATLCAICSNCMCETVCSVLLCKMQRSCSKH